MNQQSLPKRRGVVMRAGGISDSYGTSYERRPDGSLRRISHKQAGRKPLILGGIEL